MILCPVAIAVGCNKCMAFKVCPLKTVTGDAPKDPAVAKARAGQRAQIAPADDAYLG